MNNEYLYYRIFSRCSETTLFKLWNANLKNRSFQHGLSHCLNKIKLPTQINYNELFEELCIEGKIITVKLLLHTYPEYKFYLNWGLFYACGRGHRDLVYLMIERGAKNWNWGLGRACHGGHRDLVDLMIERGADDWNWGLGGACQADHRNLIKLMIERGATYCGVCNTSIEDH